MTKDEALQLAIDALEYHTAQTRTIWDTEKAIDTIKKVLAQPERKPLSEAAIEGLANFVAIDDFNYDFARAIEKAHGIV
jgi:hypothetical protein